MKILTIIYNLELGGTQRAAQNFSIMYKNLGHDVRVWAIERGGPRESILQGQNIPVHIVSGLSIEEEILPIEEWGPDIIHVHRWGHPEPEYSKFLERIKSKRPVFETNVFSYVDNSSLKKLIDVHFHLSEWCFFKWSINLPWFKTRPLASVLPYVTNKKDFYPATQNEINSLKDELKINHSDFVFGRIGQKSTAKWHPSIIDAFVETYHFNQNISMVLVGIPDEILAKIQTLPKDIQNKIIIKDYIRSDDLLRIYYSMFDLFLHAAHIGESFGMVLAEAMLCETPVLTLSTPIADNTQVMIVDHLENGLVALNSNGMIDAMIYSFQNQDQLRALGKKARIKIISFYDIELIGPQILNLFNDILKSNPTEYREILIKNSFLLNYDIDNLKKRASNGFGRRKLSQLFFLYFPRTFLLILSIRAKLR